MTEPQLDAGALVLFKGQPARVARTGRKVEIELPDGQGLSVRPKDVALLHPGPVDHLRNLSPQGGEIETAWELLAGSTIPLAELADLAYGAYTPATAWQAWQWVADGLYFRGTPEAVTAQSREQVSAERAARAARAAEEAAWAAFLRRLDRGAIDPQDSRYLRDVEELASGRAEASRVLRALGRGETPENAHALLLELGVWDHRADPYPARLRVATSPVELAVDLGSLATRPERADLTHLAAFAIDDEGTQEPDDALSLDDGRLWVHVADVASLVPPDSAADLEARARGASLYLPEGTVQMLPRRAIEALGLGLTELSPALSLRLELDQEGEIQDLDVTPSWVRVTRLTYAEAEQRIEEEPFRGLYAAALAYQRRRLAAGAVTIDLPEVKIRAIQDPVAIAPLRALRSRDLVADAMLMAGEAVASLALREGIAVPFTSQQPPRMEERPTDLAGMFALRKSSYGSDYSLLPGPHAGLGLPVYSQATSPLRRYLDLVVHQQLRAWLAGETLLDAQAVMERIGATAAVSGLVRQAERLARRHWTLVYLWQHSDWEGEGVLVEAPRGRSRLGTVLIPELDLDTQIHVPRDLPLNAVLRLRQPAVDLPTLGVHFRMGD